MSKLFAKVISRQQVTTNKERVKLLNPGLIFRLQIRDQARGRIGRNGRPGGRNFALNGTQGEVGVSLKKKKKKKKIFFFFFFFLGSLIFNLSPHKCKLW